jgi:C-terminal processing protease CtpA/Prc
MDMDGNLIEGKGIEPDIFLDFLPEEFVSDDPLLRKSLEMVEQWTK